MAVAIISDLHSNIEALTAVLKDIKDQGIKNVYCLGDLLGYGPNPTDIMDHAVDWPVVLMGNHDEAVLREPYGFNPVARAAVAWTRSQLKPSLLSSSAKKKRWKFLGSLKLTHELKGILLVHGSPRDPTMEYVLRSDCYSIAGEIPEKIRDIFGRFEGVCVCGHTHDPGVITEDARFRTPKELSHEFVAEVGKKYVLNDGSVGQPRDRDTRSCYMTIESITNGDISASGGGTPQNGGTVTDGDKELSGPPFRIRWRRVEYDFRTTMDKIYAIPELDRRAADRLADGR